jgi:hypothetical protein
MTSMETRRGFLLPLPALTGSSASGEWKEERQRPQIGHILRVVPMCGSASGQGGRLLLLLPGPIHGPDARRQGITGNVVFFFHLSRCVVCAPQAACPFYRFFPLSRLECSKKKEREVGTACKRNITGLCDVIAVITVIRPSFRLHLPGSRRPRGPIVPHSLYSSRENLFRQPN